MLNSYNVLRHDGNVLRKLIGDVGVPISRIAKELDVDRSTIYRMFDKADISIEFLLKIGKVINKDMSIFFPEIIQTIQESTIDYSSLKSYSELLDESNYWKDKYIDVLEKYNSLLNEQSTTMRSKRINKDSEDIE
ncbi:transcriptional regulator [Albibacterium sp.]|uniref:transcriptional regulator n=1 Tax=Albibacterium sp. TaxID=2952885 RepID=UPI002C9CEC9C|nr:transcriptional regulator [Albibacterium sp.]HUH18092.1 transcriptional regulator [Albibacterium sp.]